jgi:hypothetical protein
MSDLLFASDTGLSRGWELAATAVRFAVAAFFLFMAWKNLSGDAQMAADFQRWGYTDSFRRLVGWVQIVGALALLAPQVCFWAGLLLVGVLLGAAVTHLRHDPPATLVSPAVFLLLVALATIPYRPPLFR